MPGYKGHLVGGTAAFAIALYAVHSAGIVFTQVQAAQWLISALAGCLFPDIDVKSKGQNLFYKIMLVILLGMIFYGYHRPFMIVSVAAMVPMIVRHRGIFHKLWFIILLPTFFALFLAASYSKYEAIIFSNTIFFVLGAVSHLWLDLGLKRMLRF